MDFSSDVLKHNAGCDGCMEIICGIRYKCTSCPNWDYCTRCYQKASETHPMHVFEAHGKLINDHSVLKTKLLPTNNTVAIDAHTSSAEIMRRVFTAASPNLLGNQSMFTYSPLAGERSFRLLALLPGDEGTRISCKLVHVNIDDMLDYEALSYSWGNQKTLEIIEMEQLQCPVTENAYHALCHLRLRTGIRYLWVDALCIDQVDNVEKDTQVRLMRKIYSKASKVIFWLGQAADNSDLAIDFVCGATETPESVTAFQKFFERPCWYRIWCLQELSVASNPPVVMCGTRSVIWDELVAFCDEVKGEEPDFYPAPHIAAKMRAVLQIQYYALTRRTFQRGWPTLTLRLLLNSILGLRATDVRDYVYGVVGMAADAEDFVIDYSQTAAQVFTRATQHMIESSDRVDILGYMTGVSNPSFDPPLPSWVPDWTTVPAARPPKIGHSGLYMASGEYPVSALFEGNCLTVAGQFVDRIDRVSDPIVFTDEMSNLENVIDSLAGMLRLWFQDEIEKPQPRVKRMLELSPDPRASDAFWRTLTYSQVFSSAVSDQHRRGRDGFVEAPEEFANMFEILCYGNNRESLPDLNAVLDLGVHTPRLIGPPSCVPEDFEPHLSLEARIERYIRPLRLALMIMTSRQFFITVDGRMGLTERGIREGDLISILYGGSMPFILRDRKLDGSVQLISEAYIYGMMDGELIDRTSTHPAHQTCRFRIY